VWDVAVLRAHGHEPTFKRGKLSPESRKVLREINLHLHDLRRKFGSRLLEAGAGIHEVRKWLGHGNISTTDRYLAVTTVSLQGALARLENSLTTRKIGKTKRPPSTGQARRTTNATVN
jgi:integrase